MLVIQAWLESMDDHNVPLVRTISVVGCPTTSSECVDGVVLDIPIPSDTPKHIPRKRVALFGVSLGVHSQD